jgi:DnaJ family protein C protein 17
MSSFGRTDTDTIVLSLKSPKKNLDKPPKYGTALVPFKQIGDAFAAVCASGKRERGLDGIEVGWVGGKEPPILMWLKKMGKLGTPPPPSAPTKTSDDRERNGTKTSAGLPQMQTTADPSAYTSFPSSFVRSLFVAVWSFLIDLHSSPIYQHLPKKQKSFLQGLIMSH